LNLVGVKREALVLVLVVLAVDAAFIALYFLTQLRHAAGGVKLGFTVVWTLVTLAVVIRGLSRIRSARVHRKSS
jgi:hypothetical protein